VPRRLTSNAPAQTRANVVRGRAPAPSRTRAQLFLGAAILGWGLSILLGVAPHEDRVVGFALALLGAALVLFVREAVELPAIPAWFVAGLGAAMLLVVGGYIVVANARLDVTKAAILAVGAAFVAAAPFAKARVRLPFQRGAPSPLGGWLALMVPALVAPLGVWAIQAGFKSIVGRTPVEAFVHYALLLPLQGALALFGWHPKVDGQIISYATPHGLLRLNVGAACSGAQAMALFGGVLALFVVAERPPWRRLLGLGVVALIGVYVTNLLRLVLLTIVGYRWGVEELLLTHAYAGWIFFVAWALLFIGLARTRPPRAAAVPTTGTPTSDPNGRPIP
jgi:exosortase/archaeosortase family protein